MHGSTEAVLDCELLAAREARRVVRDLIGFSCPSEATDVVELLVSELVANAVRHAQSRIRLVVAQPGLDLVRVEVWDDAPERRPMVRHLGPEAESGRGLALVDAMSTTWGVQIDDEHKAVWFELACSQPVRTTTIA